MAESGSSNRILRPPNSDDPGWRYFEYATEDNKWNLRCLLCNRVIKAGITRAKFHIVGGCKDVAKCKAKECTLEIQAEIQDYIAKRAQSKNPMHSGSNPTMIYENMVYLDDEDTAVPKETPNSTSTTSSKRPRGPMDTFVQRTGPGAKERQTTVTEAFCKELREKCVMAVANWMYDAAIPFNAVNYPSFQVMCDVVSRHGPGFKAPSYHEVRVPYLDKAVADVEDYINSCRVEWSKYGCSLMVDGWTDRRQRTLINFLVNSPKGSVFIESVDASDYSKTGEKMAELIEGVLVKVGVENVIQVISDNASNMVLAGKLLEERMPHLYWTPCAAHCIDLIMEDIGKLSTVKLTLKKAMSVTSYVYVRPGVVNMLRMFTEQKELCRAGVTRFATSFLTLQRMQKLKAKLRNMFISEDWTQSKWSKEADGKKITKIIISTKFWSNVMYILKIYSPLVHVLRLVDGEKQPAMGYVYEAMDRAKEAIQKTFENKEDLYKDVFDIIDRRWSCQLHRPLHAAGHYLNPQFFYKNCDDVDVEVSDGFYAAMEKMISNEEQMKIISEMDFYRNATGTFGLKMAIQNRNEIPPASWWQNFGASAPNLRKFAVRVLNLTCSSSGCERNWSIFENVHAKRRNRLEQKRMNDLVFVKYNRALQRRFDERNHTDPISLANIDESNEWLMEDGEEDLVFEGEDLTWANVSRVGEADEPNYETRAAKGKEKQSEKVVYKRRADKGKEKAGSTSKGKGKKSVGGGSSFRLRDEDDDVEFDFEGDNEEEFNEKDPQYVDDDEDDDDDGYEEEEDED